MISTLFYTWLVLLILTVADIKGHIYWTSNKQFLCKRHLPLLKCNELAKLQEGVSCKSEIQSGGSNQCRNRQKNTERKEGLWWTLPIPPMEVDGLLENKPIIKLGFALAEKPQSSSSREGVISSTTSAARRSSTTSLPNSSLQRSNVSPASSAKPKGEARSSSSTMKINAVTTLAGLVSSSTAQSSSAPSPKEKSSAKIAQVQKLQSQPANVQQHSHAHQHHQHQGSVNAYSQCSASNKANNAVPSGNKSVTLIKSSASSGKAVPAKHVANKIKLKNHPHNLADDQMKDFFLQHFPKRHIYVCADLQTNVGKSKGRESFKLSSAPKTSEYRKVSSFKNSFIHRLKQKQRNESGNEEQQLNSYNQQTEVNLKSNPSVTGTIVATKAFPFFSMKELTANLTFNKNQIQCIAPKLRVYKQTDHPQSSELLGFTNRFIELTSTSAILETTTLTDEDPATKYSSNMDKFEQLFPMTEYVNTLKSSPDIQLTISEEPPDWDHCQTEVIFTHSHLKPYPGDRSHLINSKNGPQRSTELIIHSNNTAISFGMQPILKGMLGASRQQNSVQTDKHDSRLHQEEPLNIIKNFGKASNKLMMKVLKVTKKPSSKHNGMELMTLVDPLKSEQKSFLQENTDQQLLDHTSLPLVQTNLIDHTVLSDDIFLNNFIQSNKKMKMK